MKNEGEGPRRRVEKDVTPAVAQFVTQLAEMSAVLEDAQDALDRSPSGRVTMWRKTQPDVPPVFLRMDKDRFGGLTKAFHARAIDVSDAGLPEIALGIVSGDMFVTHAKDGGLDVTNKAPEPPEQGKILPFHSRQNHDFYAGPPERPSKTYDEFKRGIEEGDPSYNLYSRSEMDKIQDDAREDYEREWAKEHPADEDEQPPYEQLGDLGGDDEQVPPDL